MDTKLKTVLRKKTVVKLWLETCLIPLLEKGQRIVIDNATFHHGGRIAELIEAAGCTVVYSPPYSPDLNRIETWQGLKVLPAGSRAEETTLKGKA